MIDTHEAVKDIQGAGADERLAEAIVRAISKAEERAATTEDIQSLEKRVGGDIQSLEKRFDEKLGELEKRFDEKLTALEARLTNKIYAVGAVVIAVMAAFNLIG